MAYELRRAVARGLLRALGSIEKRPERLALVFCRPSRSYDRGTRSPLLLSSPRRGKPDAIDEALAEVGQGGEFLWEAPLRRLLRGRIRMGGLGDDVDAGLAALRFANRILDIQLPKAKWTSALQLTAATGAVRPGDVLVAHPFGCREPEYHQSLVVLTHVESNTVRGLVLNKPARGLFQGGVCGPNDVTALTKAPLSTTTKGLVADLGNSEGLYLCREPPATASQSKIFRGYASWDPVQLDVELERRIWLRCRAKDLAGLALTRANLWPAAVAASGHPALALSMNIDDVHHQLHDLLHRHARVLDTAISQARADRTHQLRSSRVLSESSSSTPGGQHSSRNGKTKKKLPQPHLFDVPHSLGGGQPHPPSS